MAQPRVQCDFVLDPLRGFRECHDVPPLVMCNFTWNPLVGFRDCREMLPGPESLAAPHFPRLYVTLALLVALPASLQLLHPVRRDRIMPLGKYQSEVAEVVESRWFSRVVMLLILADLTCTSLVWYSKYEHWESEAVEWAEYIGFHCLLFFLAEQGLHLFAFGSEFFQNAWNILDLLVVIVMLVIEIDEEAISTEARFALAARVFKVFAFAFDVLLFRHEKKELSESQEEAKKR